MSSQPKTVSGVKKNGKKFSRRARGRKGNKVQSNTPNKSRDNVSTSGTPGRSAVPKQFRKAKVGTIDHSLRGNASPAADPRVTAQKTQVKSSRLVTQNDKVKIVQIAELKAFLGFINAIVGYAVQRGFQNFADPNYAYWAQQYLLSAVRNVVLGVTSTAITLPRFMQNFLYCIAPKLIPYMASYIDYSWQLVEGSADNDSNPTLFNAPVATAYKFLGMWKLDTTTNSDGFFNIVQPLGYNVDDGEKAMVALFKFLMDDDRPASMFENILSSEVANTFKTDVSAFAFPDVVMGSGWAKSGDYCHTAGSEVPIRRPMLSVYALKQTGEGDSDRIAKHTCTTGGSAFWNANLFLNCSDTEVKTKRNPVFKNIDALEFIDVIARWLTKALALYKSDTMNEGSNLPDSLPIPFQLFQLIIRAVLMNNFENSQNFVQDIYPKIPTGINDNVFLPFGCGVGTCPKKGYGDNVLLPGPIIENMKCLRMNTVQLSAYANDKVFIVPVLGKLSVYELSGEDYTYMLGNVSTPTFVPNVVAPLKAGEKPTPLAETYDLIDGSDGTGPVAINSGVLQDFINTWNDFVENLAPYSAPLYSLGIDHGPSPVRNLEQTLILSQPTNEAKLARQKPLNKYKKVYGSVVREGIFDNLMAHAASSQMPFNGPAWAIQSIMISPVTWLDFVGTNEGIVTLPKHQTYTNEVFSLTMTNILGQVLSIRHDVYADFLIHARGSKQTEFTQYFIDTTRSGEGGIITGTIAKALGGGFLSDLASMLPI